MEGKPLPTQWRIGIAGLTEKSWLLLWRECHTGGMGGPMRLCWPDGKSLLEQPAIVVNVFAMISDQASKASEARAGAG